MNITRRQLLSGVAGTAGVGVLAGCTSDDSSSGSGSGGATAQASFFVFGDIAAQVAGDTAESNLLVPVGQHGHGWEPGPSVQTDIRNADLLVHGMNGFQPWIDDIRSDLEADDANVTTLDVSTGIDLLEAGEGHNHEEGDHGSGMDPHFWMDPLRVKEAVGNVRQGFVDTDPDNADAYAENTEEFRSDLDDLHERIESMVDDASKDVILVAGHDSWQYFGDRYGIEVRALTNVSPDDRPTLQDIEQAQEIIERHDLRYICADPLEPQQAPNQLVAETSAEEVLSLTALPGLTEEWEGEGWGYIDVMKKVNLPALERALDA
jgi:zinc transport system substrate-binding protein